jgi:hypothetical protein
MQQKHKSVEATVTSHEIHGNGKTQTFKLWKEFELVRQHANIKQHGDLITATIMSVI